MLSETIWITWIPFKNNCCFPSWRSNWNNLFVYSYNSTAFVIKVIHCTSKRKPTLECNENVDDQVWTFYVPLESVLTRTSSNWPSLFLFNWQADGFPVLAFFLCVCVHSDERVHFWKKKPDHVLACLFDSLIAFVCLSVGGTNVSCNKTNIRIFMCFVSLTIPNESNGYSSWTRQLHNYARIFIPPKNWLTF